MVNPNLHYALCVGGNQSGSGAAISCLHDNSEAMPPKLAENFENTRLKISSLAPLHRAADSSTLALSVHRLVSTTTCVA